MAIAASTSLGTANTDNSQAALSFNTNAIVPAGALLIIFSGWWIGTNPTLTVSGGSLTWVNDQTFNSGSPHVGISRALAPSGLSSGTTITRTMGSATNGNFIGGFYITGEDQASPTTGGVGTASGSTAAWTSGSITPGVANSIVVGVNYSDAGATGNASAPTSGWTELFDVNDPLPAGTTFTAVYQIGTSGALNPGGTWTNAGAWVGCSAAYKPAADAGPRVTFNPIPFM